MAKEKIKGVLIIIAAVAMIIGFSKILEILYALFFNWIL